MNALVLAVLLFLVPAADAPDAPDAGAANIAGEVTASNPVRSSAAHPSQAGAWAPPSNGAEGGTPLGGSTSPAWPKVRGPFSWADRVMNSTTIARSGGIYALRAKTLALYTPMFDVDQHFGPFLTVPQGFEWGVPALSADFDSQHAVAPAPDMLVVSPSDSTISRAHPQPNREQFHLQPTLPLPLGFFSYALGSKLYEDAAALLFTPGVFAPSDTLQYLRGVTAYDIHDFSLAADCFAAVPESSPYAVKAKSFVDVWNATPEIPGYKPKSPWLAGVMSAVIPGSGKIYAGDLRSGISTLMIVGALGGIAAESWIKLGGRDWRTIALSSVFGLFYIGNIYGSALSVSVIRNTYQDAEKATLLFDLRIPLHQF